MSLINQVLRDLDRRARPSDRLPAAVRAVAAARVRWSRHVPMVVVAGLLALCGAAWLRSQPSTSLPGVTANAAVPAAVAAPTPAEVHVMAPSLDPLVPPDAVRASIALSAAASSPVDHVIKRRVAAQTGQDPTTSVGDTRLALASVATTPPPVAASRRVDGDGSLERRDAAPTGPPSAHPNEVASVSPASPPARIEKRRASTSAAERSDAAYRLGLDAQQRGDDAGAEKQYFAALREDPTLASARIGLAGIRLAQGRPLDAEEALQTGLANNPQQIALAVPLAKLLAARGELTAAINVLQAGLPGAAASNADYRATYGAVLQRAGQHHDAAEQFGAALRLDPGNGVWWMGLAISLGADNRTDAARSAYKQALATGGCRPSWHSSSSSG